MQFELDIKVLLITHNDLDGRGCEIVGKLAFGNDLTTKVVRNPQHASEVVQKLIESGEYLDYDYIYITDISVSLEVAQLIEDSKSHHAHFMLLDHHGTALELNKFSWAFVEVSGNRFGIEGKNAGTTMFFDNLVDQGFFQRERYYHALASFVEKVRRYDCWEWKEIYDDQEAGALNQLFYLIGSDAFVHRYVSRFIDEETFLVLSGEWRGLFSDADRVVLLVDNEKKDAYIQLKNKQMFRKSYGNGYFGVVFAEQYISELGNELNSLNEGLKFVAIIDMGGRKVSLRTIHDDIDLGREVAKLYGGGGHAKASGFQFDSNPIIGLTVDLVDSIFRVPSKSVFRKIVDFLFKK